MIKVTCPPATAVNQLNTSYIIDILVITFPMAHLCKIYLTLILSIQRWVQFSKCMVKVVMLNTRTNSTGITIISSVTLRTSCYLIKYTNGFVVPCHLLSKHPCVLHFHPSWSDLSSPGSRETKEKKNKEKKRLSKLTLMLHHWPHAVSPPTLPGICVLMVVQLLRLVAWIKTSPTQEVLLWQCQQTVFLPAFCLTQQFA